jgi:hypothetical protein
MQGIVTSTYKSEFMDDQFPERVQNLVVVTMVK